jgi:hypothetical protein
MRFRRRWPDRRTSLRALARVGVAVAAFVLAFVFAQWWDFTLPALGRSEYQAVFLANGQTYFGRFYDRLGAYAKIEDVHYLQQIQGSDPEQAPDTRLIRRGSELHGPESRMLVPKSAVLFVEDLQDSSPMAGFMRGSRR